MAFRACSASSNEEVLEALSRRIQAYFVLDENTLYRSEVNNSKLAEETISSAYLRGDVQFFERRLKLVGGLRAEQTNVKARARSPIRR